MSGAGTDQDPGIEDGPETRQGGQNPETLDIPERAPENTDDPVKGPVIIGDPGKDQETLDDPQRGPGTVDGLEKGQGMVKRRARVREKAFIDGHTRIQ